jgi:hypothetical protein
MKGTKLKKGGTSKEKERKRMGKWIIENSSVKY